MSISKDEYEGDDAALLTSMIRKLSDALPADDFDLKEAQAVGILVTAKKEVLDTIPYANIAYLFKYISDEHDSSRSFKGIYSVAPEDDSDDIKISFIFSGMGLPARRVDELKKDADKHLSKIEEKRKKTAAGMQMGTGKTSVSRADQMIAKAKQQQSAIGKLLGNKVDRKR